MEDIVEPLIRLLGEHRLWAALLVFALAFGESIALTYLFVPFSTLMLASGALVLSGRVDPWLLIGSGLLGVVAADTCSYWFGVTIGRRALYRGDPGGARKLVQRAVPLFERWGVASLLIGRFAGPARALIPILAGISSMSAVKFQAVNIAAVAIWLPSMFIPGMLATAAFGATPAVSEAFFTYLLVGLVSFSVTGAVVARLVRRRRQRGAAR